ncbi:competence protein CoiA [Piscibacillus salipiscarius]|uniref:competence protein CoiA n=1 Tax=Piscibacillus salipiscarius TaxID=299480 RepID=UPI0006CFE004|nr:competence protein CoiA family protein [Piscibacillus salipiscarius]
MLKALNSNGQEILAYNKSKQELNVIRQHPHYCPECQQKVVLKAGQVVIPHFAHIKRVQCSHQGESQTHLEGKIKLYNWCIKQGLYAKLEHIIPSIDQRVDVLVKLGGKWAAIEFQCSPISTTDLLDRTLGLASRNVYPFWIFGPKYLGDHKYDLYWNTTLRSAVMYHQNTNQHQLFFFDPKTNRMTVATHLFNAKGKAVSSLKHLPLNSLTWHMLFEPVQIQKSYYLQKWIKEKRNFRIGPTRYLSKYDEPFMKQLYLLGLHPQIYLHVFIYQFKILIVIASRLCLAISNHFIFKSNKSNSNSFD